MTDDNQKGSCQTQEKDSGLHGQQCHTALFANLDTAYTASAYETLFGCTIYREKLISRHLKHENRVAFKLK